MRRSTERTHVPAFCPARIDWIFASKSDDCWMRRYAATSDEALHNYPATHLGRNPPPSTIQSRDWKRRGLEPVPDPRGNQDTTLSQTSPQQGQSPELADNVFGNFGITSGLLVNREEQGPEGCLLYRLSRIYGAWSSSIDAMAFSPQKTS